ncbi:hypothetical protein CYMTET_45228 [Cymbomonas tetramitiformis]|uniref:Uncharacterized protein n=1 Tax=Cymbomonas tetramitiformis TaxID=36881 RepID=A0AAE0C0F8_9CHLO|nr:hypothetical protein CYMTET_45228 [Cymbomonas tetramitiformis]
MEIATLPRPSEALVQGIASWDSVTHLEYSRDLDKLTGPREGCLTAKISLSSEKEFHVFAVFGLKKHWDKQSRGKFCPLKIASGYDKILDARVPHAFDGTVDLNQEAARGLWKDTLYQNNFNAPIKSPSRFFIGLAISFAKDSKSKVTASEATTTGHFDYILPLSLTFITIGLGTQESLNMIKVGQPVHSKPQHAAVAWGDEQQKAGAPLRSIETGSLPTGKEELQISEKPTDAPTLDVHNVFSVYTYAIVLVLCAGVATVFLLIFYRNSSTLTK